MPVDAATVERELQSLNQKIIEKPEIAPGSTGYYHIFNVGPWRWERGRGGLGVFVIPACEEGKKFSAPLKVPKMYAEGKHVDMNKMVEVLRDGKILAIDIIGYNKHQQPGGDLRKMGVFLAEGETPTKAELEEANERLKKYYLSLVQEANAAYMSGSKEAADTISSVHRMAARATGNTALPWVQGAEKRERCHVCQTPVESGAAICVSCKAVLNEQVVIANKVPGYEHLWKKGA